MDHFIQQCSEIVSTNPERPQFSIVIIYENVVSAARALRACEILRHEIPEDLSIDVSVWKTGILECQENRTKAALNSSTADVVIVAASGRDEISPYFRLWVEEWLELERERECALFTLFGDHITPHAVKFDCYVSHDKDDGMPSTTPAASIVVVAVPYMNLNHYPSDF
jgi:hypothetical protein